MAGVRIRPVNELDIESICRIDERITGKYRPDVWEDRVAYFILGEVRGGEFGMEEPTGWLEFFGVDPSARERGIGRGLTDALLAGFKKRGAHVARTMVRTQDADIARFVAAMGFTPAPVSALEKRLA